MNQKNNNIIFLTGATGLVGSHIAELFSGEGYQVRCGIRRKDHPDFLGKLPVNLVYADITDQDSLVKAVKGASVVIHTAGKVSDWGKWKDFYDTNVTGTRNVLEACHINGIGRIILTGSISCFGEENCMTAKNEQSPHHPKYPYFLENIWPSGMNYYRISKSMAAKEAEEYARLNKLNVTIIHPSWIYGEREFSSGFYEYMKFVKSGMPFGPGSSNNFFHVVYVRDLARAYLLALEKAPGGFNSYIIGNTNVCRQTEIFSLICREMGKRKPLNLPKAIAWPIGFMAEALACLVRMKTPPFLTRARVNTFYDSICYSTKKAEEEISFRCRFSLEEGIRNTLKWYKDNHLI